MDAKDYQKIYQNIIEKSPIESGVQTLVYMFLYEIIKNTNYQLIVIDRMNKKSQFVTPAGISDLAIVADGFKYSEKSKDGVLSYVEVKGTEIKLPKFDNQIIGQLLSCGKVLCTNGDEWKYYDVDKIIEQSFENDISQTWAKSDFTNIKEKCDKLENTINELAILKASYAHIRKDEYKKVCNDEIKRERIKRI